jgi:hypothetical protein
MLRSVHQSVLQRERSVFCGEMSRDLICSKPLTLLLQVTDDSELALCLAQALAGSSTPPSSTPPLDDIARWYGQWINSPPFDIGKKGTSTEQSARCCIYNATHWRVLNEGSPNEISLAQEFAQMKGP